MKISLDRGLSFLFGKEVLVVPGPNHNLLVYTKRGYEANDEILKDAAMRSGMPGWIMNPAFREFMNASPVCCVVSREGELLLTQKLLLHFEESAEVLFRG